MHNTIHLSGRSLLNICIISIAVLLSGTQSASAGNNFYMGFGFGGEGTIDNNEFGSWTELYGCCTHINNGYGWGINLNVNLLFPMTSDLVIGFSAIGKYSRHYFENTEKTAIASPYPGIVEVEFQYNLDVNLTEIELFPGIGFMPMDNTLLLAGPYVSLPGSVKAHSWESYEKQELVGQEVKQVRVTRNDNTTTNKEILQIEYGLRLEFKTLFALTDQNNIWFAPGLYCSVGINGPIEDDDWNRYSLGLNLSLWFSDPMAPVFH